MQLLLLTCVDEVLLGLCQFGIGKHRAHLVESVRLYARSHIEEWVGCEVEVLLDEAERDELESHLEVSPGITVANHAVVWHTTHGVDAAQTIRDNLTEVEGVDVLQGVVRCISRQFALISEVVGEYNLILPERNILTEVSRQLEVVVAILATTVEDIRRAIGVDLCPDTACRVCLVLTTIVDQTRLELEVVTTVRLVGTDKTCALIQLPQRCRVYALRGEMVVWCDGIVCRYALLLQRDITNVVPPVRNTCCPTELGRGDVALEVRHYTHRIALDVIHRDSIELFLATCEVLIVGRRTAIEAHKRIHLCEDIGGGKCESHLRD